MSLKDRFKNNKKQVKDTQKGTKDEKSKAPKAPTLILQVDQRFHTINIAIGNDTPIRLSTARGMVEEAKDNLSAINGMNWSQEQEVIRKQRNAKRKKQADWNKKEKSRLHKDFKNNK